MRSILRCTQPLDMCVCVCVCEGYMHSDGTVECSAQLLFKCKYGDGNNSCDLVAFAASKVRRED